MGIPDKVLREFRDCMDAAEAAGEIEPTSMVIASIGRESGISARNVLLKALDERGFVFYTNLESRKGLQLAAEPAAALVFYWKAIRRQVLVEGSVEQISDEEADAYFATRDRGSQLGAWASDQPRPLKSRAKLLKRVVSFEARFVGRPIPRPPHWSGLRVVPHMIEFWTGRRSRLHDRFRYTLGDDGWYRERLYP